MELDFNSVVQRQNLFSSTLKSHLFRKITKYQNVLLKSGIHLSEQSSNSEDILTVHRSQSFEDHIELVIGQNSASPNACKTFWKIGNRISTTKLFRWIYLLVQRTKAARILHHLDGVSDTEIQAVIQSVGQEVAVAFEYQLCLLEGDLEIVKLAQHAGACILTYLNSTDAHFAPENLLQAILEVKPQNGTNKEILKTRPLYFYSQPLCLRWRLSQVLKQPGLRINVDDGSRVIDNPKSSVDNDQPTCMEKSDIDRPLCAPYIDREPNIVDKSVHVRADFHGVKIKERNALEDGEAGYATLTEHETDSGKGVCNQTDLVYKEKCRRRISAVDMDFEKGKMQVTEYSVEASEFSPIGNDTSQFNDDDSTSVEENLDSEDDPVQSFGSINDTYQVPQSCSHANEPGATDSCKADFESTNNFQLNGRSFENWSVTGNTDTLNDHNSVESTDLSSTHMCNKHIDKGNIDQALSVSQENSATSNEIQDNIPDVSTHQITQNISDNQTHVTKQDTSIHQSQYVTKQDTSTHHTQHATQDPTVHQTPHIKHAKTIQQSLHSKQHQISDITPDCLHDQNGLPVYEIETHIRSSKHIIYNTYQPCLDQNSDGIAVETDPVDCDNGLLQECTSGEKSYRFYGCFTPYGAKCRPQVYGYRGPLHVWNETHKEYTLIYNDMVTVTRKHQRRVTQCPHDVHQCYISKTVCRH